MSSARDDVVEALAYAWGRTSRRLEGLTEEEWAWQPTDDPDLGLRWRLDHLTEVLGAARNAVWLGLEDDGGAQRAADSAADALAAVTAAYEWLRRRLAETTSASLMEPIGEVGGPFGEGTRLSFLLHVLDELVHHGAEAALLRDLYARRPRPAG